MYLWPGMIAGIGAGLGIFHLRPRHVVGIALGFAGVAILMGLGTLSLGVTGIGLALLAGVSWASFCIFRLKWSGPTGPLLTRGFGLSAILSAVLHYLLEPSVAPSIGCGAAVVAIGIVPAAFANLVWDAGFRKGDSRHLAVAAYGTPLCSAVLVAILGLESFTWTFTWRLLIGATVIVLAGVMSRTDS